MNDIEEKKEKLKHYADLKARVARLEDEIDMVKPEIELIITEINPVDRVVETDFGTFSLVPKRKYTYPEELEVREATLKSDKKAAEATGAATYVENPYVLFKPATIE